MKTGPIFFVFIGALFTVACQDAPNGGEEPDNLIVLNEVIPGTWEAVSMRVEVNSAGGLADSSFVFQINEGDWDKVFSVLPPVTYFQKDHKYRTEFRDRRDSIMSISRGVWNLMGDTLMMIEPDQSFQYQVSYNKGLLYLRGLRDWDEDGAEDDTFQEVRRRTSISTE